MSQCCDFVFYRALFEQNAELDFGLIFQVRTDYNALYERAADMSKTLNSIRLPIYKYFSVVFISAVSKLLVI